MKKAVLVLAVALLAIAMLATPVFAVGPINAEKSNNPNLSFRGEDSVSILTPGGVLNEWIQAVAGNQYSHVQFKRPADFWIGNCYTPASASEIMYNKWNFLSEDVFMEFLISVGFDPGTSYFISHVAMAGGVYFKEVYMANYV